jgi:hypothetical protein
VRSYPNAPILGCQDGVRSIAGQTLFCRKGSDGELSKAVESSSRVHPDVAFTILEEIQDDVAREAFGSPEHVCPALMHMKKTPLHRSDPEASIAVPEQSIRIHASIFQDSVRDGCVSNRVRVDLFARELFQPLAVRSY